MFDLQPPRHISTLRNFVIAGRSGEGPFTIRFADLRHRVLPNRWFVEFTPYAQDGSERHEGGQGLGKASRNPWLAPASSEPGEGALDHPAARQDDEATPVVAPSNDLHPLAYYARNA
jgi:hypothetical protein